MIKIRTVIRAMCVSLGLMMVSVAHAQTFDNMVEKVAASVVGEQVVVTIDLQKPPAQKPIDFSTQNPSRIAIDFFNTGFAPVRSTVTYGHKDLQATTTMQTGNRTRVILEMNRATRYTTELKGRQYIVVIDSAKPAEVVKAPTFAPSEPPKTLGVPRTQPMIQKIDFRRGENNAGRLVVDLNTKDSGIDVTQQGQSVIVDFLGTGLPDSLRKRFDVTDFGSPAQMVRATPTANGSRITIDSKGSWEYSSYQTDTQFVVEVRQQKLNPEKLIQGAGYKGEKLSLNFQNIDIRSLLQVFADFTGLNIITSDTVQGNLTLRLKDVPWDQALEIVLQSKNLASRRNGNVLLVAPRDELATKEKLELETQSQVQDLEPLRSQTFQLNYIKAEEIRPMLLGLATGGAAGAVTVPGAATGGNRFLSKRGSVISDPRSNQIFVTDIGSKIDELIQLIAKVDVPVKQVIIEARIVEADDGFSQNLGAKLGFGTNNAVQIGRTGAYAGLGSTVAPNSTAGTYNADGTVATQGTTTTGYNNGTTNNNFLSLPAGSLNGFAPANLAVTLFSSALSKFVNLEISALEADTRGKVISSPRVLTANNGKALIEQGTEIPYQSATSSGATAVSFRKAILKLEVTPKITPDGAVIMDVDINNDSLGIATSNGFAINTKHITTQVLVENGGTVVIGGIYQQTERKDVNKVPLLGDIPVLGNLFKTTAKTDAKTELLIFLTPRIVANGLPTK